MSEKLQNKTCYWICLQATVLLGTFGSSLLFESKTRQIVGGEVQI